MRYIIARVATIGRGKRLSFNRGAAPDGTVEPCHDVESHDVESHDVESHDVESHDVGGRSLAKRQSFRQLI